MPEATVYEDCSLVPFENDIGRAWECPCVQPKPIAGSMEELADRELRSRMLSANSPHDLPSYGVDVGLEV